MPANGNMHKLIKDPAPDMVVGSCLICIANFRLNMDKHGRILSQAEHSTRAKEQQAARVLAPARNTVYNNGLENRRMRRELRACCGRGCGCLVCMEIGAVRYF